MAVQNVQVTPEPFTVPLNVTATLAGQPAQPAAQSADNHRLYAGVATVVLLAAIAALYFHTPATPAPVAPPPVATAPAPAPAPAAPVVVAPVVVQPVVVAATPVAATPTETPAATAKDPGPGKSYGAFERHRGEARVMTKTPCTANGRPGFRGQDESGAWGCVHKL